MWSTRLFTEVTGMSEVVETSGTNWTAVDLVQRFGAIPISRLRGEPAPGSASEEDVVRIHDREGRLYELIDRTLVEKTMGTYESYVALCIARILANFAIAHDLGIVLGADGMVRLAPGLVRIPDVSFVSWARLPGRKIPDQAIADLVPDLAVEVISSGNTREEMDRKRIEYFAAGVRLVWYVYPATREIHVYSTPDQLRVAPATQSIDGGEVLPGLTMVVGEVFH